MYSTVTGGEKRRKGMVLIFRIRLHPILGGQEAGAALKMGLICRIFRYRKEMSNESK